MARWAFLSPGAALCQSGVARDKLLTGSKTAAQGTVGSTGYTTDRGGEASCLKAALRPSKRTMPGKEGGGMDWHQLTGPQGISADQQRPLFEDARCRVDLGAARAGEASMQASLHSSDTLVAARNPPLPSMGCLSQHATLAVFSPRQSFLQSVLPLYPLPPCRLGGFLNRYTGVISANWR